MITARYAAIIRKPGDVTGRDEQENSRTGRMRMQDMVTGLVKQNLNEGHKNMILVEYRLAEGGKMETDWMPVMMPYGGDGTWNVPDAGDRDRGCDRIPVWGQGQAIGDGRLSGKYGFGS